MNLTVKRVERDCKEAGRYPDGHGLYLQVTESGAKSWLFRFARDGRERWMGLGSMHAVTLKQAREKARAARLALTNGDDPIETSRAEKAARALQPPLGLHERCARKFARFEKMRVEAEAYLYRHFHPSGDLLYVGITLWPLRRQERHVKEAPWKSHICLIVVEPFATREEALEAETRAIRDEYPKWNSVHNGQRQTMQELAKMRRQLARERQASSAEEGAR
jgi:hypothetical protein